MSSVVPLNSYRGFLLTVRDNPQVASQAALLPPTRMQVLAEQKMWAAIQAAIDQAHYNLNPKRKTFVYEWQTEADGSRTDFVDVFLRTDADWSFVTREPQWDSSFGAIVDAFLFARKSVEGREASFAAQELVPVYKRHLDTAVAKAPTKLFITLAVPAAGYDFSSKSIRFLQAGTNVQQGSRTRAGSSCSSPPTIRSSRGWFFRRVPAPQRTTIYSGLCNPCTAQTRPVRTPGSI